MHLLGADYPVYPGAERPLVREPHVAGKFHGENGLGDVELPLPDCAPETTPAWDALYEAAKRMPGELRLVATGPLTNVAIALTKYPELKTLLHSIALMGGAAVGGNVTPAAEFNIYDDPDAAQIVFKSGVPLVMCGLDVTMQAELRPADWDEMAGYGNRCGSLVRELFACAWSAVQTVGLTGSRSMIPALSCIWHTRSCSREKWRAFSWKRRPSLRSARPSPICRATKNSSRKTRSCC